MDISNYGTATALLTLFVIGGTELVKQAYAKNWRAVSIIVVAALIGGIGGAFLLPVIGIAPGLAVGLSGSGLITGVQNIGKGTATPTL